MKKDLKNITEEEVKIICDFYNEPYISYITGKWHPEYFNLAIQINTESILKNNKNDSYISIYYDGKVELSKNNGKWNGSRYEKISPLITIDFLRSKGYVFEYDIPVKIKRKIKLNLLKIKKDK